MPLTRAQAASEVMWHLVTHDAHGYSQPHRAGDGTTEELYLSDGERVVIHGGDYDCSEAVRMCYAAVGVLEWDYWDSYTWTGNERSMLLSHGFEEIDVWDAQDGDVLFVPGHTELCLDMDGSRIQAGFRHSEDYDIDGEQGDQTGDEATWSPFDGTDWECAFRYVGPEREDEPEPIEIKEINMDDWAIIAYDGGGHLYAAGKLHPLANEDEQKFVEYLYAEAKRQRDAGDMPHIILGESDVPVIYSKGPWGKKLAEILAR